MRLRMLTMLAATMLLTTAAPFAGPAAGGPLGSDGDLGVIICTGSGVVSHAPSAAGTIWSVYGIGSCQGDGDGTYWTEFEGVGISDNLGLCSGDVIVTNLGIIMKVTLHNVLGGSADHFQTWHSPLTTFPVTTPFLIDQGGSLVGAGTINSRIFLNCPTAGSPVAQFDFAFDD